jgi:hypothetical protein
MGKRRRPALQYTSSSDDDDDDNAAPEAPKPAAPDSSRRHSAADGQADPELVENENVLEETRRDGEEETRTRRRHRGREPGRPAEEEEEEGSDGELEEKAEADEEEDDEGGSDAVPLGDPVEVLAVGKQYAAFQYEGNAYKLVSRHPATATFLVLVRVSTVFLSFSVLSVGGIAQEDTAMFSPDEKDQKPYVGIIKVCDYGPRCCDSRCLNILVLLTLTCVSSYIILLLYQLHDA